jgi:hypothetical protein
LCDKLADFARARVAPGAPDQFELKENLNLIVAYLLRLYEVKVFRVTAEFEMMLQLITHRL